MSLESNRKQMLPAFQQELASVETTNKFFPLQEEYLNQLLEAVGKGMSSRQALICFNKWMHGFNTFDVDSDLELLQAELDEAKEARVGGSTEDFVLELADVAIYCYGIASMVGFDLDTVITQKMKYNLERTYEK